MDHHSLPPPEWSSVGTGWLVSVSTLKASQRLKSGRPKARQGSLTKSYALGAPQFTNASDYIMQITFVPPFGLLAWSVETLPYASYYC